MRDCELFSLPYTCTLNEGECVKPGGQPATNSSTPAKVEGESRRKAKAEGEAEVHVNVAQIINMHPFTDDLCGFPSVMLLRPMSLPVKHDAVTSKQCS